MRAPKQFGIQTDFGNKHQALCFWRGKELVAGEPLTLSTLLCIGSLVV